MKLTHGLLLIFLTPWVAGCDQLGFENPALEREREEAEGKAIGSGCRQTGRALEDCYQINRRSPKAAIFAGWREMDGYMRDNKIEEIRPDFPMKPPPGKGRPLEAAEAADESAEKKPVPKDAATSSKPAARNENAPEAKPSDTAAKNRSPAPAR